MQTGLAERLQTVVIKQAFNSIFSVLFSQAIKGNTLHAKIQMNEQMFEISFKSR